jgi:hypothetical protein
MAVLLIIVVGLVFGFLGGCNFLVAINSGRNLEMTVGAATVGFVLFVPRSGPGPRTSASL